MSCKLLGYSRNIFNKRNVIAITYARGHLKKRRPPSIPSVNICTKQSSPCMHFGQSSFLLSYPLRRHERARATGGRRGRGLRLHRSNHTRTHSSFICRHRSALDHRKDQAMRALLEPTRSSIVLRVSISSESDHRV